MYVRIHDMTVEPAGRLQRAQNYCVRFIFNLRWDDHVTPYFNQLSVLKLNILREYHTLCHLFSIIKTRSPSYLSENFNFLSNISERVTRQGSSTIAIPIHRTAIYNKSFTVSVSRLWNSLPNHLKTIEMRARFGAELRAWLLAASRGR